MKKKVFNTLGVLAVAAILTLNVSVVASDGSSSILTWDLIGKILAQTSGTSGSIEYCSDVSECTFWDATNEVNVSGCKDSCTSLSGIPCTEPVPCYNSPYSDCD